MDCASRNRGSEPISACGLANLGCLKTLNASVRNSSRQRSLTRNNLASDTSTWVRPKPEMSLRASVPCLPEEGTAKAFGLSDLPPGTSGLKTQTGCPAIRSALGADPSTGVAIDPLNGNPLLATTTICVDQLRSSVARGLACARAGIAADTAPEKLCLTSKSDDARSFAADITALETYCTVSLDALSMECE